MRTAEQDPILKELTTFPGPNEARVAFNRLKSLSLLALTQFALYGQNEVLFRRIGSVQTIYLFEEAPFTEELMGLGLVEETTSKGTNGEVDRTAQLTALGRETARIFTASGPAPHYLIQLNEQTRQRP